MATMWSTSGFGPRADPIPTLYGWPAAAHQKSWSASTSVCRWYTVIRLLLSYQL